MVRGVVQPTAITCSYLIRLVYREMGTPRVYVDSPPLARRAAEPDVPVPHTYSFNSPGSERPCVFYPDGREWHPAKPVATTIMPWLLSWLVDYEIWHATGQWLGGGIAHHEVKRRVEARNSTEDRA